MPPQPLYGASDSQRRNPIPLVDALGEPVPSRSAFRRGCDRLIHSSCFRRLQGKTQVFGITELDFFRNRLTHSMEVAQIAKAIVRRINRDHSYFRDHHIDLDIVEFASLAHDLGHPPFGHNGEEVLNECMQGNGGFEGNAQTLRITSHLAKKLEHDPVARKRAFPHQDSPAKRFGLNPTARCLASVLKYDFEIPCNPNGIRKGYYRDESSVVRFIRKSVTGNAEGSNFKTIECSIMDCADDIAYSSHDLEDSFKGGFLRPIDLFAVDNEFFGDLVKKVNATAQSDISIEDARNLLIDLTSGYLLREPIEADRRRKRSEPMYAALMYGLSEKVKGDGYYRGALTSDLISMFVSKVEVELDPDCPALSKVVVQKDAKVLIELLKRFVFEKLIRSPELRMDAHRGRTLVKDLFDVLIEQGGALLPHDFREVYDRTPAEGRPRVICDFISGMTDRYAIEFHTRLFSESSAFKPV